MNYEQISANNPEGGLKSDSRTLPNLVSNLLVGHETLSILNERLWRMLSNIQGVQPKALSSNVREQDYPDCYLGLLQTEVDKQFDIINNISVCITQLEQHL